MRATWLKTFFVGTFFLLAGTAVGWYMHNVSPNLYKGGVLYQSNSPYTYVDPLLACDVGTQDAFPEFAPLKEQLTTLVNQKVKSGDAEQISIYVRSLRSARWLEINPTNTFAPASLLKVFVMMAYFKEADDTDSPALLNKQIKYEGSFNPSKDNPGETIPHLQTGQWYTVGEVIHQMIVYSDNDALNTLVDNFDPRTLDSFQAVFSDLNIPSPVTQDESSLNYLTVDKYAMVFRVLFATTYLSTRYSEQTLALLAQAQYKGGIVAGVPAELTVAHKFGVTTVPASASTSTTNELHDCGIVYYPKNHPYLLCVMTQGKDFAKLQETLKDISNTTYAWLDTFYTNLPPAVATTTQVVKQ